jgi:hypothetical protein
MPAQARGKEAVNGVAKEGTFFCFARGYEAFQLAQGCGNSGTLDGNSLSGGDVYLFYGRQAKLDGS